MSEEVAPTKDDLVVFAPEAWRGNEGETVPVIDRDNHPEPRQMGFARILAPNPDGSIDMSVSLFSATHDLRPRGDLSTNEYDVQCSACTFCSCHNPERLMEVCGR